MSGESAQDIEVSITAPNRSFHATVIASDVSWSDRFAPTAAAAAAADPPLELPHRRPIWSSAFGNSVDTVDTDSEAIDPMVNSATSLSQDSYDGFAVEFIAPSKDSDYLNGDVSTGAGWNPEGVIPSGGFSSATNGFGGSGSISATAAATAAAITALTTAATDSTSASVEMRPVGFAETDRGSISCEMITPTPVLVGNGHVPSGEATVTSSSTVSGGSTGADGTVTTTSSSSTTVTCGGSGTTTVTSSSTEQITTVSSSTVTGADGTVSGSTVSNGDSEMTTHVPMAPGSTFQMSPMESHEEHAEAPDTPRDRAMSMHERSMLAHDLHALSSTMDTIKDDEEEVPVGSSSTNDEKPPEEPYTPDRRQSLTGMPVSATTFMPSPSQPTIFEAAEESAAAPAAPADAAAPTVAAPTAEPAAPAEEPSPYLRKLLDAQEATRQLMALLGESTQMLGTLPTAKKDEEKKDEPAASAALAASHSAADVAGAAAAAMAAIDSAVSFTSQSSMTSSSTYSSSTTGATVTESAAAAAPDAAAPSSPAATAADVAETVEIPVTFSNKTTAEQPEVAAAPVVQQPESAAPAAPETPSTPTAAVPQSPALEISLRPIDITFDDGSVVKPSEAAAPAAESEKEPAAAAADSEPAAPIEIPVTFSDKTTAEQPEVAAAPAEQQSKPAAAAAASVDIPVTVWKQEDESAAPAADAATPAAAAPGFGAAPAADTASDGTQNATICNALESLAANMTTVTTQSSSSVTTSTPFTLDTTVQLQPATSPTVSLSEPLDFKPPTSPGAPDAASLLHESTMSSLSVGLPTPRPTPEPDQERFVTNNEQSEATITKSSFSFEASSTTSSSTTTDAAAAASSTTDYIAPTTSVVLQAEETSAAAAPAAEKAPTITPAAVDVPMEIVRGLDSSDAWAHSAPAPGTDSTTGTTVPITVVPAEPVPSTPTGGPPPLARDPPLEPVPAPAPVPEEPAAPSGPPPLARERPEEEHHLERSVMIERRVLSPDSSLHLPHESTATQQSFSSTHTTSSSTTVKEESTTVDSAAPAAAATVQPDSAAAPAAQQEKDAPIDIPVTITEKTTGDQQEVAAPAADAAAVDIPVTVWKPESQEEKAPSDPTSPAAAAAPTTGEQPEKAVTMPTLACELTSAPAAEPAADAVAPEVPVATAAQQEQQAAAAAPAADAADAPTTSPTTAHAPMSLESTFQITPSDEEAAHPPDMLRDRAMSIHERSLLAHESSGFQSGLDPVPENDNVNADGEVHVANAATLDAARRRASLAPGEAGTAATSGFQVPSTSCLFTVDEGGAGGADETSETAPVSTASPSEAASTTTMASSTDAVIDVTAPEEAVAAKPQPPPSGGVQWLTESEPCSTDEHSRTPESVIAAAPATTQQPEPAAQVTSESATPAAPAADQPSSDLATDAAPAAAQSASDSATTAAPAPAPTTEPQPEIVAPAAAPDSSEPVTAAAPAADAAPPSTPKSPSGTTGWMTEPAATTTEDKKLDSSASTTDAAPPATPKSPSGTTSWVTEPATTIADEKPAAAPANEESAAPAALAAEAPPSTPKSPSGTTSWVTEPTVTTTEPSAIVAEDKPAEAQLGSEPAAAAAPAAPTTGQQPDVGPASAESAEASAAPSAAAEAPPSTPKSPADVSWVTVPATITIDPSAQPPETPKTPTGVSFITESTAQQSEPAAAPAAIDAAPQTPKTPSAAGGVTWPSEPAAPPAAAAVETNTQQDQTPATPKTPSGGVSWITEPAAAAPAADNQVPPQTPKTPTGVAWITEPAAADAAAQQQQQSEALPQTPKTPTGVSWITEPAVAAPAATSGAPDGATARAVPAPLSPSVIDITAPIGSSAKDGGAASPRTPTSPGIRWASETTRTGGSVDGAGAPPTPKESTFVVNAPWEGADPSAAAAAASAPDADGVTWITEPAGGAPAKEPETPTSTRPPLTRSESTRSDREASSATDITVRAATPQRKTLGPSVSGDEESLTNGVTQEALGTKVRKLSWADQQQSSPPQSAADDSFSAAIDDYEKKLNETTAQTRELVDLLCQTGNQITENSMKMSDVFSDAVQAGVRSMLDQERRDRAAAALSPIAENGEPMSREPPPQLVAGALPPNVESVIVSCEALKYVTGSLVLESANILVTDDEAGLFLFTLDSKVVRHVTNPLWKHASSPVIFKDRLKSYILILMDCKDEEDGAWVRHIVKFTENLDYMEKVECPKWIRERTIISDRLAVNRYESIYYCANGEIFSGLYELAPTGKWTELLYRQSESFVDMLAFAIIGPIQQILIVEGRRDHVLLCSIRESVCVEARRMAICERPGALARDESGRLFVMNRAQAAVQIVDTRVWAACRNMALVDKFVPHFSASFGMLVIPQKRAVKVHKYAFEWDD